MARILPHCPEELRRGRLRRLGEGIGKVVYASEHWVVKRERTPTEVVALILLWKFLRRIAHTLPFHWGDRLLRSPSRLIRVMRLVTQTLMAVLPRSLWYSTHVAYVFQVYVRRDLRGKRLAEEHLTGTGFLPEHIEFPPEAVLVAGWPGWLTVREATERVEATLEQRISHLAAAGDYERVEVWLERLIETRRAGWSMGLFSTDAHLKNFGVIGDRIVLLDTGGLTDRWSDIDARLEIDEEIAQPHLRLGLRNALADRPDLAARFNEKWKSLVNRESVRGHWPEDELEEPLSDTEPSAQ
jgi:hypothetical protein